MFSWEVPSDGLPLLYSSSTLSRPNRKSGDHRFTTEILREDKLYTLVNRCAISLGDTPSRVKNMMAVLCLIADILEKTAPWLTQRVTELLFLESGEWNLVSAVLKSIPIHNVNEILTTCHGLGSAKNLWNDLVKFAENTLAHVPKPLIHPKKLFSS